jgi:hypothetical protein
MPGDRTNHLDSDPCDEEDVVALMYEIGRRRGADVDRRTWTVHRHDTNTEPVPADAARDAYRIRRDERTTR